MIFPFRTNTPNKMYRINPFWETSEKINIITDGLVTYLDAFNSKSYASGSSQWKDLISTNNASLYGGFSFVDDGVKYMSFDGVSGYAGIPHHSSFNTAGFTIYTWIKTVDPTTLPGQQISIFDKWYSSFAADIILLAIFGRTVNLRTIINGNYVNYQKYEVWDNSLINKWVNLCATYDGSIVKVYVNGELLAGSLPQSGSLNSVTDIKIARFGNGSEYTKLDMSELAYYGRALSNAEILENINNENYRYQ